MPDYQTFCNSLKGILNRAAIIQLYTRMKSITTSVSAENDVHTFRRIRKSIGVLGVLLPITLFAFSAIPFFETHLQSSISHYYYTNLRELFTGVLCAVGLFLLRYKGHKNSNFFKNDSALTNIAGAMAFGVALVPTDPSSCTDKIYTLLPLCASWLGWIHYGFAATFFFALSIISIYVFTIGQEENRTIPLSALNENNIYKICGYLMLSFLVLIPIAAGFKWFPYSTLVFEALMLFAFGISWLTKGRILGERGEIGKRVYREIHS